MPVKIRLTRMGKKKQPSYRVVVMDSRKPRDGKYIEQIGRYDARQEPSLIEIDNARAVDWLQKGAQPTERAKKLLEISGAWTEFRVARGDVHVVGDTPDEDDKPEKKAEPKPVILDEIIEEAAEKAAAEAEIELVEEVEETAGNAAAEAEIELVEEVEEAVAEGSDEA
ncbi:MAG: 30S ribosomal protein S16 [Actinomycetota bacterium]|nr:30S ribosomal protein S16 [Actinomycetota bacterium]